MRATRSTMMFYRRKLLLGLLQSIGRPVNKVDLQKCLFLVCVDQKKSAYEFIPHRFGCFSFQIDADKRTLTKYGLVSARPETPFFCEYPSRINSSGRWPRSSVANGRCNP